MTNVGLVGCGRWGQHILRDLNSLGCRVHVVERSAEGRARAAERGAHRTVATVAQLEGMDGVVVATPVGTHAEFIHAALDLDVPVFTEKAMTDDPVAADALLARAPDSLFVMEKWRYHPAIERLRELATSGALGEIVGMSCIRQQWGDSHPDTDPVWTLLPHDLSIADHLLGHIPPAVEARRIAGVVHDTSDRAGSFWCDYAGLVGLLGTADGPWLQVDVSGRAPQTRRETVVYGRDATAVVSDRDYGVVEIREGGAELRTEPVADTMPLLAELEAFVGHLRGTGGPPAASAAQGAEGVRRVSELRTLAAGSRGARRATADRRRAR